MGLELAVRRESLLGKLAQRLAPEEQRSNDYALSLDDWAAMLYNGLWYQGTGSSGSLNHRQEEIRGSFAAFVEGAYRSNGIVFACIAARMLLFSEAEFQFRRKRRGEPSEVFGSDALAPLESPEPGKTTGDLLSRMEVHNSLAGNAYVHRSVVRDGRPRLRCLRPDWVTIVLGSNRDPDYADWQLDAELLGYLYHPGGRSSGKDPDVLLPEQVAHFAPIPDPLASYRGMSWLTPIVREIMGDKAATEHKLKYFENGATVNLAVSLDIEDVQKFNEWVAAFKASHEGTANAYKTLFLGLGATPTPIGGNLRQADFKITQGAGETRIAAASGMAPIIVGLSEGLEAATYSNYGQARRRVADGTLRPLWRNAAGSLSSIIAVPAGAQLAIDTSEVAFLREDEKDNAEIAKAQAATIKQYIDAGFEPASAVAAVRSGDLRLLKHTGLTSVQLQKPGEQAPNGSGSREEGERVVASATEEE